jgi:predicted alpha/beta hydrolase
MNSFIFSYHPSGLSLEGYLADAGFEVWRADLRAQGESRPVGPGKPPTDRFGLEDLALVDLAVALDFVLSNAQTHAAKVDVIGASLGGTLMFIHAVQHKPNLMGALVALGSPVRWIDVNPVMRVVFASPLLIGLVKMRGTRKLAERLLPLLARRLPWVLSIYMNPDITDTSAAAEMVKTVEDPNRHINRQIAHWIAAKDLVIGGTNISDGMRDVLNPLLCVVASGDGIVPRATAEYPFHAVSSRAKRLLVVGDDEIALAHADLFVSREAHERVFRPLAAWLAAPTAP